eukprot:TRINITY_DN21565_c0_g2_i1.p1 TRINITY_DN21565_c0_g2~~TRINITY_DN21565_c0_g2_i1.p1  ORF type:complete len:523 (-),score=71.75 TRINITY_DN21565_c0_g2_i1:11-1579(-)
MRAVVGVILGLLIARCVAQPSPDADDEVAQRNTVDYLTPTGHYNVSGRFCRGGRWLRWRRLLQHLAATQQPGARSKLPTISQLQMLHNRFIGHCPEGITSIYLAGCSELVIKKAAAREDWRSTIIQLLKPTISHFAAPVLLRRMKLGEWPDFGQARILEVDLHRERYSAEVADLVLSTSPRFAMQTAPAPHRILPGWWWSRDDQNLARGRGRGEPDATADFGLQVVLDRTPMLTQSDDLLFVDVGAFDGGSLLRYALKADMNHSVLAFEPLPSHRENIFGTLYSYEMLQKLRIADDSLQHCLSFKGLSASVQLTNKVLAAPEAWEQAPCAPEGRQKGSNAILVKAGLSAADTSVKMTPRNALSSVLLDSYAGSAILPGAKATSVRLVAGARVVDWWTREVRQRPCADIHLLKIDAEGSEFAVLRGLEPLLAKHRVRFLFLEYWPWALLAGGTSPLGVLRWLAHYGFLCRFLGEEGPMEFEAVVAWLTSDESMSDFFVKDMAFADILCEDIHWPGHCEEAVSS